ncbi:MAG: helix-turn-helix transcriptional regulator [Erysipelotrichales bacterium]|nr:helix-turn-helix transcriptional regulator [Erysipelotrichales bacterium]
MISSNDFGKFIVAKRKEYKISQVELAEKLNVDPKTLSKWENGGGYPDMEAAYKIEKIFNISLTDILNENFDTKIIKERKLLTFDNIFIFMMLIISIIFIVLKSLNIVFVVFKLQILLSIIFILNMLSFISLIFLFDSKKSNNRKLLIIFMKIVYFLTILLMFIL